MAGTFHLAGPEAVSRYTLGRLIAERDNFNPECIRAGKRSELPAPGPLDVRLDSRATQTVGCARRSSGSGRHACGLGSRQPEVLHDGWAQPYIVLTHCRLLWAATYGTIIGKAAAATWAREHLSPPEFDEVLSRAISHRLSPFDPAGNRSDPSLVSPTSRFVLWATAEVHRRAESAG